jgi:hypothetical protein
MAVQRRGESKQGLVVTLVFFILATLGLGIATYYGFADQDRLTKEKKDAEAKEKTANAERDWYKFQSQLLRAYMGHPKPEDAGDFAGKASQFFSGGMANTVSGAAAKADVTNVTELVQTLNKTLPWNPATNAPAVTYESLLAKKTQDYNALEKRYQDAELEKAKALAAAQNAQKTQETAQVAFKAEIDKQSKAANDELANLRTLNVKQDEEIKRLGVDREGLVKKSETDRKKLGDELKIRDAKLRDQTTRINDQEERINLLERRDKEAPPDLRTDWKVTSMDRTGKMPFINLGSADNVKPQTTFRVHGVTADGRPIPQSKGSIEVVNVLGPHLSQARVTEMREPSRDPILPGDVLYNPTFSPDKKKHVAIAGLIDLDADGRDDLNDFLRILQRQNVAVDAYLDPKDGSIKGPGITVNTDYLIIGEGTDLAQLASRDKETRDKLTQSMAEIQRRAKENGVQLIGLRKYLDLIGFRVPRATGEQVQEQTYSNRPTIPVATPPEGGKKERDEKPMENKDK